MDKVAMIAVVTRYVDVRVAYLFELSACDSEVALQLVFPIALVAKPTSTN